MKKRRERSIQVDECLFDLSGKELLITITTWCDKGANYISRYYRDKEGFWLWETWDEIKERHYECEKLIKLTKKEFYKIDEKLLDNEVFYINSFKNSFSIGTDIYEEDAWDFEAEIERLG